MSSRNGRDQKLKALLAKKGQPVQRNVAQAGPDTPASDGTNRNGPNKAAAAAPQAVSIAPAPSSSPAPVVRQTRQQRVFTEAVAHVVSLKDGERPLSRKSQKIYGSLCHKLPVLVRTNGLCQTLAFIEERAKDSSERGEAYRHLRSHIASVLGVVPEKLVAAVGTASLPEYQLHTRNILAAWVFYKRFAVSILGVESGDVSDEDR